jgi:uncharacterized RDD family membrane protein YckC
MSTPQEGNRYAPPAAHVADVQQPHQSLELADRGSRLGAALIDFVVMMIVVWVVSLVTPWHPFRPSTAIGPLLTSAAVGFALFVLVNGFLLVQQGQTVGKTLVKLRITRPDGSPVPAAHIIGLRYGSGYLLTAVPVVGWLYGLIDALMIFGQDRRCLHDRIAGTIVIKA